MGFDEGQGADDSAGYDEFSSMCLSFIFHLPEYPTILGVFAFKKSQVDTCRPVACPTGVDLWRFGLRCGWGFPTSTTALAGSSQGRLPPFF